MQPAIFPIANCQKIMIDAVSQVGILLLLLLLTGMDTDLALIGRLRRAAGSVSIAGISVPFGCGVLLGEFMPQAMLPQQDPLLCDHRRRSDASARLLAKASDSATPGR